LLTLGSFILIAGSLSDLFGRKKVLVAGLVGFLVASIFCAIAPSSTFLIIARAIQGLAGALLVPSSLALIISSFSGEAQGKAIGTWTAWISIAYIIGPLLGGFLVDSASWRWVFGINIVPIAITLVLLKMLKLPEKLPTNTSVDVLGGLLCVLGLGGPVYSFIEQPNYGWSSPLVIVPLAIGVISFVGFLLYEKTIKNPMLPLGLFKVRNFSVGNIATTAIYAGLSVATFILIIFEQLIGKYSALQAGISLLPVTLIMFVLSSRFGALAGKYGPRLFMAVGPSLSAVGFLLMLRVNSPIVYWSQIFPAILVFGLGLSMTVAPLTSAVLGDIDKHNAGVGSAINNAISRIAGLIAIALIGLIIGADAFTKSTAHGVYAFHKGALAMAVLLLLGGGISATGISNQKRTQA
jgi:EmrB/QacA subfamily drug resistance transporter